MKKYKPGFYYFPPLYPFFVPFLCMCKYRQTETSEMYVKQTKGMWSSNTDSLDFQAYTQQHLLQGIQPGLTHIAE